MDKFSYAYTREYCVCVCVCIQLCPTCCNPMECSLPGSSDHETFQARILEWVAISYSRGSSRPRDQSHVSCFSHTGRWILYHCAPWDAHKGLLLSNKKVWNIGRYNNTNKSQNIYAVKEAIHKNRVHTGGSTYIKLQKIKVIHSDRKQTNSCLGTGVGVGEQ